MPPDRLRRVLYLHGLESGPRAGKVLALRADGRFEVTAPALETRATQDLIQRGEPDASLYRAALERPVSQAVEAITAFAPEVIVGSSFGGAVLLRLLHEGHAREVPAVFLAAAGLKLTGWKTLPAGVKALLVHGRGDDVVPVEHSRRLADSAPDAVLVEVHDDHRLTRTTHSGLLASLVALAAER